MHAITPPPFHSPSQEHKFLEPFSPVTPKPLLTIPFRISYNTPKQPFFLTRAQKLTNLSLCPSLTPILTQNSKFFVKLFTEKVSIFLLGAFLFMGSLGLKARPSLASPSQASNFSSRMDERTATQVERSEKEEMYDKILEEEPRDLEVLKVVVQEKMRRGKLEEAVKYVKRLIGFEPEGVEWRLLEALCYEMMGELSMAKRLLEEILKERPLLLRALHGLALVMHKNHEGPAVFDMLNKALAVARSEKRVTEERNIRILIAQMKVVKGELEEGLETFQDLINDNPRDFRSYLCQEEAAENFDIYQNLVPEEFPQRAFLDDLVLDAMKKSSARTP